jgi:hypothetical protein
MANSIVQVNVSLQVAPTPATLQQMGAFVSHGGTILSPGSFQLLTQLSDLTPYLTIPAAVSTIAWSGGTVAVATTAPHNLPVGQTMNLSLSGFTPSGFNGVFACTITGASGFTFPLITNPGSVTIEGTWQNASALTLTQMATTFFAQGFSSSVYVLEFGATDVNHAIANLSNYLVQNPNSNYVPGAVGYFYSYLLPRTFDANVNLTNLLQSYENPTARTYFFITTTLATYSVYNNLQKCAVTLIESPPWGVWPQVVLTATTWSSGVVTATTALPHNVLPGQWFQIQGAVPTGYNGYWLALPGTAGSTLIWNIASNPGAATTQGTLVASAYVNAGATTTEFSLAAPFYVALNYNPSTTNRVTPYAFSFVFGVTPFPTRFQNSLLANLKAAAVNYIGTGAEGGISNAVLFWGTTMDANQFNYWYSIDWVQINLDLDTANAVINGSNNPINPLYYNQAGIDALQAVAVGTMNRGITYGLVLGQVVATSLDGPVLDYNLDQGIYADKTVVNAVPFVTYSLENPSDYKIGKYAGLGVIYMPQQGFINIVYNVVATQLIAQ